MWFFHMIKGITSVNPTSLSLSHTSNTRTFAVSWTGGSGNGACKIQFLNGSSVYTDVQSPTSLDCDTAASSSTITLPSSSPWTGSGQSKTVRIVRISDSAVLGTFGTGLSCSSVSGSSSPTPNTDEDCNGNWDNAMALNTAAGNCPYVGGCNTVDAGYGCSSTGNYYSDGASWTASICHDQCVQWFQQMPYSWTSACCAWQQLGSYQCTLYYGGSQTSAPSLYY